MKYTLFVSSASQQDIADALDHYLNINKDIGLKFLDVLDEYYQKLEAHPQYYSYFGNSETLRSVAFIKFPYSLVFQIQNDKVFVFGLYNHNQNPDKFLKRSN